MSKKDYHIRFAGKEMPAHKAWVKLEAANVALELLTRYNKTRKTLATELTRETEIEVRKRLAKIELLLPPPVQKAPDVAARAKALLQAHGPDEALDMLVREMNIDCDLNGLVQLAGVEAYEVSLGIECGMLRQNAISFDQIAELWNDAKLPALGRSFWDGETVERLYSEQA